MNLRAEQKSKCATARVLLVDDEPKLRESLAEGLRLEEWDVITAGTGTEALEQIRSREFDLVVLDWMLPDFDGMDLLQRIRAHVPHLPVLMITARCSHSDQVAAFQNGATDYLTKPFAFEELVARSRVLVAPGHDSP